jgi:hypothetical protein
MKYQRIIIDKNNYIRLFDDGNFELHCSASGPLGANVYYFENRNGGYLKWTQRRSYGGVSKKFKVNLE